MASVSRLVGRPLHNLPGAETQSDNPNPLHTRPSCWARLAGSQGQTRNPLRTVTRPTQHTDQRSIDAAALSVSAAEPRAAPAAATQCSPWRARWRARAFVALCPLIRYRRTAHPHRVALHSRRAQAGPTVPPPIYPATPSTSRPHLPVDGGRRWRDGRSSHSLHSSPRNQTGSAPRRGPRTLLGSGASPRPSTPTQRRSSKHCWRRPTVLCSAERTGMRGS